MSVPEAAPARGLVAIVGRPNVGKSSLFNRLARQSKAIVQDVPGVTRDRLYAGAEALGRSYLLVDTGGFDPESTSPLAESVREQVQLAVAEADLVVCVLDSRTGVMPADREAIALLRRSEKPALYVANKVDSRAEVVEALDLYRMGIPELVPISTLHGHGMGELEEAIAQRLPEQLCSASEQPRRPSVALIGRPNAGKSSLANRLLGEARQVVDSSPGTTVDSVDTPLEWKGRSYVLIDTAGIRRRRSVKEAVEALSVMRALRAVERCDVAVLLIDAERGVGEQDAKIAGLAAERGRGLVIALNKVDQLRGEQLHKAEERVREVLSFSSWAPVCRISALRGTGVQRLMAAVGDCVEHHQKRVGTAEVNRFFEIAIQNHPPPTQRGRVVRIYYVTQARTRPPTFVAITNEPDLVHFSYQRYVVNQLRERFGFHGTPVRVYYRRKKKSSSRNR